MSKKREEQFTTFKRAIKLYALLLWKKRGVWLRGLFCWMVGASFLTLTESKNYDIRFGMRTAQSVSQDIVLILVDKTEWIQLSSNSYHIPDFPFPPIVTDNFFWDQDLWFQVLDDLLKEEPKQIAVNFSFDEHKRISTNSPLVEKVFTDSKIIWAATLDQENRPLIPKYVDPVQQTPGLIEFNTYDDGITRSFPYAMNPLPHVAEVLARGLNPNFADNLKNNQRQNLYINFAGKAGTFQSVSLSDLVNKKIKKGFFKGKTIIIGSNSREKSQSILTPLGYISRAEALANATSNLAFNQVIRPVNGWLYSFLLLSLAIFSIWLLLIYPQTMSLTAFAFIGLGATAFSLFLFDNFYLWTPLVAPVVQLGLTYIVFITHQLTLKEGLNWKLEQEKKYLTEVKQLKDNFVSLISHDLKTPIAKIQAIIDRLGTQYITDSDLNQDLSRLRNESQELHRYIHSILRVMRVESSDFKLNKDASDLNCIIERVVKQVLPLANDKEITIETELEPLFSVDIDEILVQEVVLNIIENAIKYTPAKGFVKISSSEVEDNIIFVVEDSGHGISKEEQSKIFDKFHRGKEHSMHTKGSGLGLYLVKYFIELHGGEVFLESELGQGTTIGFTLPLSDESETKNINESPPPLAGTSQVNQRSGMLSY